MFNNPEYLKHHQYKTPDNLKARMDLHLRFSTNVQGLQPWMHQVMGLQGGMKVLEVGCGPGTLWNEYTGHFAPGLCPVLTDFSPGMVKAASEKNQAVGLDYSYAVMSAQEIAFPTNTFDAVLAHFMLYHVPDLPTTLGNIRRVLKPGAKLFAMTVGDRHMARIGELVHEFDPTLNWEEFRVPFTVQNGKAQLEAFFHPVQVLAYQDVLHVTEVEPLLAYVASSIRFTDEAQRKQAAFAAYLEEKLRAGDGVIKIEKETSMFVAEKA